MLCYRIVSILHSVQLHLTRYLKAFIKIWTLSEFRLINKNKELKLNQKNLHKNYGSKMKVFKWSLYLVTLSESIFIPIQENFFEGLSNIFELNIQVCMNK